MKSLILSAILVACSLTAYAAPITVDTWYVGSFTGPAGSSVTGGLAGGGALDPGAPAWTFSLVGSGVLTVIDCCAIGDQFTVLDFGSTIGSTILGSAGGCVSAATCDALAGVGRGDFVLGPGAHSITMTLLTTIGTGNNFFRVSSSAVPEPSSIIFTATGLGAMAWLRRRRSTRSI